jgi:hypothetical protein
VTESTRLTTSIHGSRPVEVHVTREERIDVLHELVEHAVAHRGLRADLHDLISEIPDDQVLELIRGEASLAGPQPSRDPGRHARGR